LKRYVVCVLLAGILAATGSAQQKKRVAVLNFEYAAVQSQISAVFGTNVDVGKGVADLLVEKLVKGGSFSVIERKAIDKIMNEQNFSNSDRADASSAAKIGRLLGVQAIIIGSITQFGRDDKKVGVGGGAFGGVAGRYGLGGVGKKESQSRRKPHRAHGQYRHRRDSSRRQRKRRIFALGRHAGWGGRQLWWWRRRRHRHVQLQFRRHNPGRSREQGCGSNVVELQQNASNLPTVAVISTALSPTRPAAR